MLWLLIACRAPDATPGLTALAASSLSDALPKVAEVWRAEGHPDIAFSFDSSGRLSRQLQAGVPADLFFSADAESVVAAASRVATRRDLLGNTLVIAVPAAGPAGAVLRPDQLPGLAHVALAAEGVPAGRYARAALDHLGVWEGVAPRVVTGDNVRTTLAWVARGEAEAAIVYRTDVAATPGVREAFAFAPGDHPPIVYVGAALREASPEAEAFLGFCSGPAARQIFAEAGFLPL